MFTMKKWIFIFAIVFLASADEIQNELQDHLNKGLEGALKHIPQSTLDNLPPGINASSIPSIEEGEELLKEKCNRNGNNESFENAMLGKEALQFCLHDLVDFKTIKGEIETAKPTGDLDIVFRKYCKKTPVLRECINNFTSSIEPCLDQNEKDTKKIISNVTEALINFICFKEGDRIALFIAEGGPDCLSDKNETIQQCLNATFGKYFNKESSTSDLPNFKLEEKECRDINALQKCVVKELETCSEPTPANIVDSLFNYVRKVTPCAQYKPVSESASSASTVTSGLLSVSLVLLSMYLKY